MAGFAWRLTLLYSAVLFGDPRSSRIGPSLLVLYMVDVFDITASY